MCGVASVAGGKVGELPGSPAIRPTSGFPCVGDIVGRLIIGDGIRCRTGDELPFTCD